MEEKKTSFVMRCKNFFGYKPGQSIRDFSAELKELTADDKADLVRMFNEAGMPTEPPAK